MIKFLEGHQVSFRENVSGKKLTNLKIGGNLSILVEPDSEDKLLSVVRYFKNQEVNFRIIGAGSNLLIPDEGLKYPVIKLPKAFRKYQEVSSGTFNVMAAIPLMRLSTELSRAGYSGLEFAGGIPASFGGAVKMNAGAHGGEMSEVVESVRIINQNGELQVLNNQEMKYSYRSSVISNSDVILSAKIRLNKSSVPEEVLKLQQENLAYRKETQPLNLPSAGSIFKNPLPSYAGELIEKLGFKGHRQGGAIVSDIHANWIVNESREATARDVRKLVESVQEKVFDRYQIKLKSELVIW